MDSIKSFKGYGKVSEAEEQAFRKKTRRRLTIIIISIIILLVIIIGAAVGTAVHKKSSSSGQATPSSGPVNSLKSVCSVTLYPDSCFSSIAALEGSSGKVDPERIFELSLQVAIDALANISTLPDRIAASTNNKAIRLALADCKELFDDAIEQLNSSLSGIKSGKSGISLSDIRTWLSTAVTDQDTCLDGIADVSPQLKIQLQKEIRNSTEFTSNSLAIASKIMTYLENLNVPINRKLLAVDFPAWVSTKDRKLLQEANPIPDIVVAQDGTGNFTTISDAVAAVPVKSKVRFVIYVKEGKYVENVLVDKSKWNLMIYGDGSDKTIVSGSKNNVDGTPTFATATFVATGRNFLAKNMGFENTAGPEKHQAVAMRSGSDRSVFYQCSFDAYQDTLYAHSNRQFYSNCDVKGTIDFIFGNAAVVLQACSIQPRQALPNQQNTITAQGKSDPNQNTGISIQRCKISALDNVTVPTYLGRPWRAYSTTIFMQSGISDVLSPAGWVSWTGENTEPPHTIFYAEYMNSGPGSAVTGRVKWAGYNSTLTADQAEKYTVTSFIQGNEWLPETGVTFDASL